MSKKTAKEIKRNINPLKILWPLLIGFIIIAILLYRDYQPDAISKINFTNASVFWLIIALLLMCVRHFGYMVRLRILSENDLSLSDSILL